MPDDLGPNFWTIEYFSTKSSQYLGDDWQIVLAKFYENLLRIDWEIGENMRYNYKLIWLSVSLGIYLNNSLTINIGVGLIFHLVLVSNSTLLTERLDQTPWTGHGALGPHYLLHY